MQRHVWGTSVAAVGVLASIAFLITIMVQTQRIARERDLAQQARTNLESVVGFQADMLSSADPEEMGRRLLDDLRVRVAETIEGDFSHAASWGGGGTCSALFNIYTARDAVHLQ